MSCLLNSKPVQKMLKAQLLLHAAIDYLEGIGFKAIEAHEHELVTRLLGRVKEIAVYSHYWQYGSG